MDKADDLYRQGNEAYKQNRLKDAYTAYKAAWDIKKSYDIAGNLGAVELAISMPRDAAEHLLHSLRQFPANGKQEARERTRQRLDDALKQIGTLTIKANVDEAEIFVDGKAVGKAPLNGEVFVEPGTRKIEAKLQGYDPLRLQIQVAKGAAQEVNLKLTRAPTQLSAGGLGDRPARSIPVIVAGAAVSAAAIGTGIGLLVVSGSKGSEADDKLTQLKASNGPVPCSNATPDAATGCTELKGLRSDHDTFHNVAIGTFLFGGVVAAATVGYVFLTAPKSKPSDSGSVRVLPVVSKEASGLWLTGAF